MVGAMVLELCGGCGVGEFDAAGGGGGDAGVELPHERMCRVMVECAGDLVVPEAGEGECLDAFELYPETRIEVALVADDCATQPSECAWLACMTGWRER